jgi:hypothetical protein
LFVDGDPGWCLGRRFLRRERQLLGAAECLRKSREDRQVGVKLDTFQAAQTKRPSSRAILLSLLFTAYKPGDGLLLYTPDVMQEF